jgi:hypothetical protein
MYIHLIVNRGALHTTHPSVFAHPQGERFTGTFFVCAAVENDYVRHFLNKLLYHVYYQQKMLNLLDLLQYGSHKFCLFQIS